RRRLIVSDPPRRGMSRSGSRDPYAMLDVRTREEETSSDGSPSTTGISSVPGSGSSTPPVRREEERRRQLRKMKRRATGMLVVMTVFFILITVLTDGTGVWGYVQAMAEASMVGGLADWFAVTALFRHPLGIPIPHTDIVPAKKDRVGRTLGAFVQRNFLTREVIEHRLRSMQVGLRLAEWLADADNARTIARNAATAMSSAAQMLRDEDVQEMIDRSLAERVRTMHLAPLLGKVLTV